MIKRWMIIVFGIILIIFSLESSPFVNYKPIRTQLAKFTSVISFGALSSIPDTVMGVFKRTIVLEQPNEDPKLLDGRLIVDQWLGMRGRFVVSTVEKIPIYVAPDEESEFVRYLKPAERVRAVFKDDEPIEINEKKGYWVFLKTENGQEDVGWVIDFDLGYKTRFISMKQWIKDVVLYERGEVITTLTTNSAGDYVADWFAKGDGIRLKGVHKGKLLRCNNVAAIVRNDYMGWYDFFFFMDQKEIEPEWKYRKSYFNRESNIKQYSK